MDGTEEGTVWDGGNTSYHLEKVVGNGAFGIVWRARSAEGETVAIKKVLLDRRYHNRELQMMKVMDHENVVKLRHYFEKQGRKKDEIYLHLVMDFLPETIRSVALQHHKRRKRFAVDHIRAYLWQTFRALEYIHARRICHRDIKPDNLLCDPATLKCRLCDFGCSKARTAARAAPQPAALPTRRARRARPTRAQVLVKGQPNVSYICSRYYRAPELMFGASEYAVGVDVWSVGTILMELLLGHLPFQGQDSTQQHLVEIMKLLGTPSERDMQAMHATCSADDLPKLKPFPWDRIFPPNTASEATDLAQRLLRYDPDQRLTASQTLAHPFFDGAQQLIDGSANSAEGGAPNPPSRSSSQSAKGNSGAEWEKRLNKCYDELERSGSGLAKLEGAVLRKLEASVNVEQPPAAIARQIAATVRDEISAGLKARDEALRTAQKRLIAEARQLQLSLPLEAGAASEEGGADAGVADSGDAERVEAELAAEERANEAALAQSDREKADLLAQIRSVQEQIARYQGGDANGAGGGGAGPPAVRASGSQTDDEARAPGYGRRAVAAAPTRVGSLFDQHQMAGASPLQGRAASGEGSKGLGGAHLMAHTDNLGQVTPLSSFSPAGGDNARHSPLSMQRTSSAGCAEQAPNQRQSPENEAPAPRALTPVPCPRARRRGRRSGRDRLAEGAAAPTEAADATGNP